MPDAPTGPLAGVRVLELAGIGPVPHAGMLLADLGALVVRIDRADLSLFRADTADADVTRRGKLSVLLDAKDPLAREALLQLVSGFDVVLEGNRPGVVERLGLGPEECLARNPRLVYGRMTGWGQTGPIRGAAGHDITYISIAGALHGSGQAGGAPQFATNLLGDYGGGSLYLVVGVLAALREAALTGRGQTVDAAIVDGTAHLLTNNFAMRNAGLLIDAPGEGIIDGGAPFYSVYETADGGHVSVGAIEPQFFAQLIDALGIDYDVGEQYDRSSWPRLRGMLSEAFASRQRAHWQEVFEGTDACVAPVLSLPEAAAHPQISERGAILPTASGGLQPGLAPRFSAHEDRVPGGVAAPGADTRAVLDAYTSVDVAELVARGAAVCSLIDTSVSIIE